MQRFAAIFMHLLAAAAPVRASNLRGVILLNELRGPPVAGELIKRCNRVLLSWEKAQQYCAAFLLVAVAVVTWSCESRDSPRSLLQQLKHSDRSVRFEAARKLAKCDEDVVPTLISYCNSPHANVRDGAALAGYELRQRASALVPSLILLVSDEAVQVRQSSAAAIGRIGVNTAGLDDALRSGMEDQDAGVRALVAFAIGKVKCNPERLVPVLAAHLGDSDHSVVNACAESLLEYGQDASRGLPLLLRFLCQRESLYALEHACTVIAALGCEGATAVPCAIEALRDSAPAVRQCAASLLGEIGDQSSEALRELLTTLESETDSSVGHEIAYALGRIGAPALPGLVESMKARNSAARARAVVAIKAIRPQVPDARELIAPLLNDESEEVRQAASAALEAMDEESMEGAEEDAGPPRRGKKASPDSHHGVKRVKRIKRA